MANDGSAPGRLSDSDADVAVGAPRLLATFGPRRPASQSTSLANILGRAGLEAATAPPTAQSTADRGEADLALAPAGSDLPAPQTAAFEHVLRLIQALQGQLHDGEAAVEGLREEADALEERRRLLARQADLAERERDAAVQRSEKAEAAARHARVEASAVIERYMEVEVLKSQLQVTGDELVRLREEISACRDELAKGKPRLLELEDVEAECLGAIAELDAAHTQEAAELTACHLEDLSLLRSDHATRIAEAEACHAEDLAARRVANAEELGRLRSAVDSARWEAEVFAREQKDGVRELALRQRENARLVKKHGEVRQEALELAMKLETVHMSQGGAPAREAELHAVRQRHALLERTAAEWQDALERKHEDCAAWRRLALQRGTTRSQKWQDDCEMEAELGELAQLEWAPPKLGASKLASPVAAAALPAAPDKRPASLPQGGLAGSSPPRSAASADETGLWSSAPTPTRTRQPVSTPVRTPGSWQGERAPGQLAVREGGAPPRSGRPPRAPPGGAPPWPEDGARLREDRPPGHPAEEFSMMVLRAAQLQAMVEEAETRGDAAALNQQVGLAAKLEDAENEVEMLAFLMDDVDVGEAEALLGLEAQQQPWPVARRLRAHLEDMQGRGGRRS